MFDIFSSISLTLATSVPFDFSSVCVWSAMRWLTLCTSSLLEAVRFTCASWSCSSEICDCSFCTSDDVTQPAAKSSAAATAIGRTAFMDSPI